MTNFNNRKYIIKTCRDGKRRGTVRPYTMEETVNNFHSSYQIVDKGFKTPCWLWNNAPLNKEYPKLTVNRKYVKTHRFSWELHFGKIPKNKGVLHKCDVPQCVNPDHLFLGNQKINVGDAVKKDRWPQGRKLTEEQVLEIRRIYAEGNLGYKKLSRIFQISAGAILQIVRRITWQHI